MVSDVEKAKRAFIVVIRSLSVLVAFGERLGPLQRGGNLHFVWACFQIYLIIFSSHRMWCEGGSNWHCLGMCA